MANNGDAGTAQVVLAYCHNGKTEANFTECYAELRLVDSHHRRLIDPSKRPLIWKGLYPHYNRNVICKAFRDTRTEPWLMFLDTDMLFTVNQFYQLYDESVAAGPGVHAGLYYGIYSSEGGGREDSKVEAPHGAIDIRANWMKKVGDKVCWIPDRHLAVRDDLSGCGMGFTLIHRDVIMELGNLMPKHNNAWFGHDEIYAPDLDLWDTKGEDTTFCDRVTAAGFKIFGHDSIALGHDKQIIVTWEMADYEQRRQQGL